MGLIGENRGSISGSNLLKVAFNKLPPDIISLINETCAFEKGHIDKIECDYLPTGLINALNIKKELDFELSLQYLACIALVISTFQKEQVKRSKILSFRLIAGDVNSYPQAFAFESFTSGSYKITNEGEVSLSDSRRSMIQLANTA